MTRVIVGLGANLGDPVAALRGALAGLRAADGVEVVAASHLYVTAPVGPPQPDYLNAAVALETVLAPLDLLALLHALEAAARRVRVRGVRFGPRTLDLDILLWDGAAIDLPGLVVPHPRLVERRFALEPLVEIAPDATLPDGTPLAGVCAALPDQGVERLVERLDATMCCSHGEGRSRTAEG
jgi:2-amino-4-hydroxy-6-hydroxymethyldihydropteridine diphosphokinase